MGAKEIRAGGAFVEIYTKTAALQKGLNAAQERIKSWGQAVKGFGGKFLGMGEGLPAPIATAVRLIFSPMGLVGAMVAATKTAAGAARELQLMARRTGMTVTALSEFKTAGELVGVNAELLEASLKKMQMAITANSPALDRLRPSLAAMGLNIQKLRALSPEEQFTAMAEAISRLKTPADRATAAMLLFGETGTKLLPMLAKGAAGIEEAREEVRNLGKSLSEEHVAALARFEAAVQRLAMAASGIRSAVAGALSPALTGIVQSLTGGLRATSAWLKAHQQIVLVVFTAAAALAAFGATLIVVGTLLEKAAVVFGALSTLAGWLASGLGFVGSALLGLLNPAGLVVAALLAMAIIPLYWQGAFTKFFGWITGGLGDLAAKAYATISDMAGGIMDALAVGDWSLAGRVAWAGIKLVFSQGVTWLHEKWIDLKEAFMAVWVEASFGIARFFTNAWALIKTAAVAAFSAIHKAWVVVTSGMVGVWRSTQNSISKAFVGLMGALGIYDEQTVAGAKDILDQEFAQEQEARQKNADARLAAIDAGKDQAMADIEAQRQGAIDALETDRNRAHADRAKSYRNQLDAASAEQAQAQREFDAARRAAGQRRADMEARLKGAGEGGAGAGSGLLQISTTGAFNAAALFGMGVSSANERTARATEETARHTRKTSEKIAEIIPVFVS